MSGAGDLMMMIMSMRKNKARQRAIESSVWSW